MNDRRSVRNVDDVDQLIFDRRVAIDRFVDGNVERHDLVDAPDIVPEAIHERRVSIKQAAECSHVVSIPGGLECTGRIFWSIHFGHRVVIRSLLGVRRRGLQAAPEEVREAPEHAGAAASLGSSRSIFSLAPGLGAAFRDELIGEAHFGRDMTEAALHAVQNRLPFLQDKPLALY
jgi:hypothetical protein